MRKRIAGYGLWLLLACCLYFFENNAGTLIVLASTLLLPLFPAIRHQDPALDEGKEETQKQKTLRVQAISNQEEEEPGDVRSYLPGDPVNRIHWKLSAKRGELLIREAARENAAPENQTEKPAAGESAPL